MAPIAALAEPQPEMIAEKMAVKLSRGLANVATGIVELPKQTILTGRELGGIGYVYGPIKGITMTVYRCFIGAVETVFFMVPQPGYYDTLIDPAYVWEGWEPKRDTTPPVK
jgi:putative exosortase-associated protein (TIGR04073 family)